MSGGKEGVNRYVYQCSRELIESDQQFDLAFTAFHRTIRSISMVSLWVPLFKRPQARSMPVFENKAHQKQTAAKQRDSLPTYGVVPERHSFDHVAPKKRYGNISSRFLKPLNKNWSSAPFLVNTTSFGIAVE